MRRAVKSRHDAEVLMIFGSSRLPQVLENIKSESSTNLRSKIKPGAEDDETSDATQLTSPSPEADRAQEPSLKRKFQQAESDSELSLIHI